MKRKNIVLVVILSLFTIYLLMFLIVSFRENADNGVYMFESIEECQKISDLDHANKTVTVYETSDFDKNIKDLSYTSFYGAKFESDELNFEIFAYEFSSENDAREYYINVSGMSPSADPCYLSSGGLFSRELLVINGKNAYTVYTSFWGEVALSHALEDVFSIKMK